MLELKPDLGQTLLRMEAFWERRLVDRPLVQFILTRPPDQRLPLPTSHHASPADRWMDAQYQTELAQVCLSNTLFPGDSLPVAWPNLGPEVFPAFYGCPLHFGDYGTSWTQPVLHDWSQADSVQLDWKNLYLLKLVEMTNALLAAGKDKFITGMTDWHPGGDCLAALRDPQTLALDLLDHPTEVRQMLTRIEVDYYAVYDFFYQKLRAAGQPITAWINLACRGRYYIPSNDFSGLISSRMFAEFFLPGIERECQMLDHSIYHLDGPAAIRHLPLLLEIPKLDAIQFVPTPGDEAVAKWAPLYRRIQAGKKGLHFTCSYQEIDLVMELLEPHGLFLLVRDAPSLEAAEHILRKMERWSAEKAYNG